MTYGFHIVLGKLHTDNAYSAETLPNHGDDDMIATLQNLSKWMSKLITFSIIPVL